MADDITAQRDSDASTVVEAEFGAEQSPQQRLEFFPRLTERPEGDAQGEDLSVAEICYRLWRGKLWLGLWFMLVIGLVWVFAANRADSFKYSVVVSIGSDADGGLVAKPEDLRRQVMLATLPKIKRQLVADKQIDPIFLHNLKPKFSTMQDGRIFELSLVSGIENTQLVEGILAEAAAELVSQHRALNAPTVGRLEGLQAGFDGNLERLQVQADQIESQKNRLLKNLQEGESSGKVMNALQLVELQVQSNLSKQAEIREQLAILHRRLDSIRHTEVAMQPHRIAVPVGPKIWVWLAAAAVASAALALLWAVVWPDIRRRFSQV